jgi:hypothetical protein
VNMLPSGLVRIVYQGRYVIRRIMVWLYHTLPPQIAAWRHFLPGFWAALIPYVVPATLSGALSSGTFLLRPPLRYLAQTATLSGANYCRYVYQ